MYVDTSAEALFLDQYEPTVSWGSRFPFELSAGGAASFYLVLWGGDSGYLAPVVVDISEEVDIPDYVAPDGFAPEGDTRGANGFWRNCSRELG